MIRGIPRRPTGQGPEAAFMQWAYDNLVEILRAQEVHGQRVSRTTRGHFQVPPRQKRQVVKP